MKNCVFCANKFLLASGSFLALASFTFKCSHDSSDYTSMTPSLKYKLLSLMTGGVFLFQIIYTITQSDMEKPFNVLKTGTELFSSFIPLTILLTDLFVLGNDRYKMYEGFLYILKNGKTFGLEDVLTADTVKNLRRRSVILISVAVISAGAYVNLTGKYLKFLQVYSSVIVTIFITTEMRLHGEILDKCYAHLKQELNLHVRRNFKDRLDCPLLTSIKNTQRLHLCVMENFRFFEHFSIIIVLLGILLLVTMDVTYVDILIFAVLFKDAALSFYEYVDIIFILTLSIIMMLYILTAAEKLKRSGDDLLSYLFRYPICKLEYMQGAHIELLIKAMAMRKPIVNVSNIFLVGIHLVSDVIGTFLTYLLVMLQLYVSLYSSKGENI